MSVTQRILRIVEPAIFQWRWATLAILLAITAVLGWQASKLEPSAGWLKMVPQEHQYMETFLEYYDEFGGANRVLVALRNTEGDIYEPEFMEKLRELTDEVFFIPGVQRERVSSLYTPNILYVEVQPTGLSGSTVVPADYQPTEEMMEQLRSNVSKANVVGRLVSDDQRSAMVVSELMDIDPVTGERVDYTEVGRRLEEIRERFEDEHTTVHIIGFAKVVDDMTQASTQVVGFFALTLVLTAILLWIYVGSFLLGMLPLVCSIAAVIWEMGLLHTIGFGLDPFAILVPFLILAVSTSHGVQFVNAWAAEVSMGLSSYRASIATFRRLAIPGTIALVTDTAGFLTIYLINIDVIREMSINAAMGVAAIIITNKALMPILLTITPVRDPEGFMRGQERRNAVLDGVWRFIAYHFTRTPVAIATLFVAALIFAWSFWTYPDLQIGTVGEGVPELRPDSRFNQDARFIGGNFGLGLDQLNIIAETEPDACIDYELMSEIDRFAWHMKNRSEVRETMTLMDLSKLAYAGLSEGRLNAQVIPRNRYALAQSTALVPTTSGMLNEDCSALNVFLFTVDHDASSVADLVQAVKDYREQDQESQRVDFQLASGNVGVMAATNEVVADKEIEVVMWVYVVVLIFLWLSFKTISGVLCVAIPLSLVSASAYGVMAQLGIGMKVATLPVIALAVGIGVDYGIYIYSQFADGIRRGLSLEEAYYQTLRKTGKAVVFTGIALGLGVSTWLFSALQFQADMGIMLVYMFTANMFAAILVLPALARFLAHEERKHAGEDLMAGASEAEGLPEAGQRS